MVIYWHLERLREAFTVADFHRLACIKEVCLLENTFSLLHVGRWPCKKGFGFKEVSLLRGIRVLESLGSSWTFH